ncbi:MAG TPA: hypothetical protein VFE58_01205 [Tepidisphaeraceae bacterium]|jgi:hypothetical protein|nr:hypothetical protein [Tepidisphaeraceae bacterium]
MSETAPVTRSQHKWLYLLVLLISLALLGAGVWQAIAVQSFSLLAAGSLGLIAALVAWPLLLALDSSTAFSCAQQAEVAERLQQISIMLDTLSEQQLLSDRAKSVAYREKDREALRRAIHEEIARRDFEAALVLTTDMEAAFGYKQESDRFRREIESRRQDDIRRQITDAVSVIDRHARGENWPDALREAERVMNLFPDHPQAQTLPQEVEHRRQSLKHQLMDQLRDAEQNNDVDSGIDIVRRLDVYLTPTEAESVRDTARNVFKQKLIQLGQQFTAALNENRTSDATRIGNEITRDYPNTRMAQEVRERLMTPSQIEPARA